jgi:LysM repeat protein
MAANQIRDPTNLEIGQTLLIPPRDGLRVPIVLHEIGAGDTLLDIAMQYSSSVKDIVEANPNLNTDSLPAGQTVAVPIVFNEARPAPRPADSADPVYYTVQEGDMPLLNAAEYDIPVELLLAANDIIDPTTLQIGRQLLIPPNEGVSQGAPIILYELEPGDCGSLWLQRQGYFGR